MALQGHCRLVLQVCGVQYAALMGNAVHYAGHYVEERFACCFALPCSVHRTDHSTSNHATRTAPWMLVH
jgi:hypothetical protein